MMKRMFGFAVGANERRHGREQEPDGKPVKPRPGEMSSLHLLLRRRSVRKGV
jgi:hypothetical protein